MTFDWHSNPYSEEPTQYKAAHLLKLDDGNFALQPNNRLEWKDMSFTTHPFPEKPDWKVDDKDWMCESVSDRWVMNKEDESIYYYRLEDSHDQETTKRNSKRNAL